MQQMNYTKFIILSSVCVLMAAVAHSVSAAIYVDVNAPCGTCDGTSWDTAYKDLQSALEDAVSGDEIWVAEGTYYPSVQHRYYFPEETDDPRYQSFQMINGVGIYGGFAGIEMNREQRNPTLHVTILSGDIGTIGVNTDNCYHVFYHHEGLNLNNTAILDGFTITDGYADGTEVPNLRHSRGAGMYNSGSSPAIANCIFRNHVATEAAGAMYNWQGTALTLTNCTFSNNSVVPTDVPDANNVAGGVYTLLTTATFTNCTFTGNTAYSGGGMYHFQSSITLTNCTFSSNNTLYAGGGVLFEESPASTLTNCTFSGNTAQNSGGAIVNFRPSSLAPVDGPTLTDCIISGNSTNGGGGGMANGNSSPTLLRTKFLNNSSQTGGAMTNLPGSSPTIINCIFSGNSATVHSGGAIWNQTDPESHPESPQIINSTFYGNTAANAGGAIHNYSSNPTITNCILWGNSATLGAEIYNLPPSAPIVTYCNVQGGYSGTGNLNVDPLFVNAGNKDFHLQTTSPCIDKGNNAASNLPTIDFEGDNRIVDGDRNGTATVDMGVDEVVPRNNYLLWTK